MTRGFTSAFKETLDAMIDFYVGLGHSENTYLPDSRQFDRFCAEHYPEAGVVTEALAVSWLHEFKANTPQTIHGKIAFLRFLASYQRSMGLASYILPNAFTCGRGVFLPYIFTDDELSSLFRQIDSFEHPRDPFRGILYSTYFRMVYTCGLRPGEARRLKRNEVDLASGEIRIIRTKFHKSRVVVMSDDMALLARKYASIRDGIYHDSAYFFPSPKGMECSGGGLQDMFRKFFAQSKPDVPVGLLPHVRIYDLRHRFATAALQNWLDEGVDLTARLPYLRTYMGHKELSSTAYYIHLLPERLARSNGIDWDGLCSMIPEVELWQE